MQVKEPQEFNPSIVMIIESKAYTHPRYANVRFPGHMLCPHCSSEIAHVVQDDGYRRILWCGTCGTTYKERDMVA